MDRKTIGHSICAAEELDFHLQITELDWAPTCGCTDTSKDKMEKLLILLLSPDGHNTAKRQTIRWAS